MKRTKFTQQEMLCFAEFEAATVTTDEVVLGDLIINPTDKGLMVEGPGGTLVGKSLDDVTRLMRSW
tara:strand:+ start:20207 stop:20404 length:198 start_codon:yes stop_codon:yes gene_type:complete